MKEIVKVLEKVGAFFRAKNELHEEVKLPRASARVRHFRDGVLLDEEVVHNVITTVGRDFLHTQGYGASGVANGLNYIGLSNDTLTETSASTVLSNEIAANGLTRAVGTIAHTTGTNTTTVDKTFTATGAQSAQKAALFTASSGGTMNHVLAFTQRALITSDTLQITFTITLG